MHAPHYRTEILRRMLQVAIESDNAMREAVSDLVCRVTVFRCVACARGSVCFGRCLAGPKYNEAETEKNARMRYPGARS